MRVKGDLLRLFGKLSRRRKWQMLFVCLLMLIGALAEVATLGAVIPFLATFSGPSSRACEIPLIPCGLTLVEAAVIFSCIAVVATIIRIVLLYVSNRFTYALGADIGNEIYEKVLYQPYQYHVSRNTSEIIGGVNKVSLLVQQVINPIVQGSVSLVMAVGIFIALLNVDLYAAILAMVVFGSLYAAISFFSRRALRANGYIVAARENDRIQAIQEGLGGIRDVILDGAQVIYAHRFSRLNTEQRKAQANNFFIKSLPKYVVEGLGMLFMIALALWVNEKGRLVDIIPVVGAMALGAQKILPQLQQIYTAWASVSGNEAVLSDILSFLDNEIKVGRPARQSNVLNATSCRKLSSTFPLIDVRGVTFRYASDRSSILSNINLRVNFGERVGIIGETGSGKSTLIDLLMGLLEPVNGVITVDGDELTDHTRGLWRSRVAHVPQSIYLSDATLAENIAFACEVSEINFARVEEVARKAQLSDFIDSLPNRYDTKVGERGVQLSGGQRQRIGLARALYKNADVLVLDEATSALDVKTENAIMQSIESLGRDVTIFIVAHRVSTLSLCDRIVEIERGHIKRECAYRDLLQ